MKHYISPSVQEQFIQNISMLCSSGGVSSNVGLFSDDKPGNAENAF